MALSTSPHWRSSIARTSGVRLRQPRQQLRAARRSARRRSSCGSGISGAHRGAPEATACHALQHREDPGEVRDVRAARAPRPSAGDRPFR